MGKYIVELKKNETLYKATTRESDGTAYVCSAIGTPYTAPDLEQVRKKAYEQGRKDVETQFCSYDACKNRQEEYQRGLADAWEAARKICLNDSDGGLTVTEIANIFDVSYYRDAMKKYSASEAIEKIRQYEQEKKEILVGDEVTPRETEYDDMIVTRLWKDDYDSDCIDAIGFDGRIGSFLVSRVSKTGKHYEISDVLQKMKESENG